MTVFMESYIQKIWQSYLKNFASTNLWRVKAVYYLLHNFEFSANFLTFEKKKFLTHFSGVSAVYAVLSRKDDDSARKKKSFCR